jgi:DNA-binding LytR/AlgR family response regulator
MNIRALIVDDEPLACRRMRQLLEEHPDIEIVGEATNAAAAAKLCSARSPDVLLVDIEMPMGSGLELVGALSPRPAIIFTTAHPRFAVDAFDVNAVDYVLKPISKERLARALNRLRQTFARREALPEPPRRRNRIAVRSRSQIVFIPASEIEWIGAEGNYSRVNTRAKSHLIRELMASLESRLDPSQFVRVHRSAIVNVERIQKIVADSQGGHSVVLASGTQVRIGASHRESLERVLGEVF